MDGGPLRLVAVEQSKIAKMISSWALSQPGDWAVYNSHCVGQSHFPFAQCWEKIFAKDALTWYNHDNLGMRLPWIADPTRLMTDSLYRLVLVRWRLLFTGLQAHGVTVEMSQISFDVRNAALSEVATEGGGLSPHSVNGHENTGGSGRAAPFHSILFDGAQADARQERASAPTFFADLNLDQIVDAITAGKQEYDLQPFFCAPLRDPDAILYRQEIFRDLEDEAVLGAIRAFAQRMSVFRRYLALVEKLHYHYHQAGWFLEAAGIYRDAVAGLVEDFSAASLTARGLIACRSYLANYVASERFAVFQADTQRVKAALAAVQYCVLIKGDLVKVRGYEGEVDYSVEVEETFARFKQGAVKDYRLKLAYGASMNHIEAQILDLVAKLNPDVFASLDTFCAQHSAFVEPAVTAFDSEIQFYVAYIEHMARIKRTGLKFCYPQVTVTSKEVRSAEGYDLALAHKLVGMNAPVVTNDFYLQGPERVIVVSGPNQGGKTTFARTFGQLHYLASLGLPVPGREAHLFLPDGIFTHFEKVEDISNLRGKLQDDLVRIHDAINQATPDSIVIMNEIFSSTVLQDALFLSQEIMARIVRLDALGVWVTFIDELATFSEQTVSMVSTIVPENPAQRTFKVVRKPADGLAYALSIAEKHRLTYHSLLGRIQA